MACIAACCTITSEVVAAPIQKAAQTAKVIFGGAKITGKVVKIPKIPAPPKTASPSRGSFNPYPSAAAARQAAEMERRRREEEQRRRSSNPRYY